MKKFLAVLLASVLVFALVACNGSKTNTDSKTDGTAKTETKAIASPDDLEGKKVAVQMGTTSDDYITELIKNGKNIEAFRYEKVTQCFDDLKLKRADAVLVDSVVASYYMGDDSNAKIVWKNTTGEPMGICLKKGNDALTAAVEKAIDTLYYNGKIAELATKYFGDNFTAGLRTVTEQPVIDKTGLSLVKDGTLMVGMEIGYPPMEYLSSDGTTPTGFDVEVAGLIAELLGLKVELVDTAWDGIFEGVNTSKYDMVISAVSITEERQAAFNITNAYVSNQLVLVVNK